MALVGSRAKFYGFLGSGGLDLTRIATKVYINLFYVIICVQNQKPDLKILSFGFLRAVLGKNEIFGGKISNGYISGLASRGIKRKIFSFME